MNGDLANKKILCDIARCSFEVINRLLERDRLLSRELRSNTTSSRQVFREECITVEMAATLREQFPEHVEITLFTPPEETLTGADWYWRIEKCNSAIHARVQAKRVQRTSFGQPDNDGRVDINLPQLQQLIQQTTLDKARIPDLQAWVATYAQFRATPPCGEDNLQRCQRHEHDLSCTQHMPSLWIAQAQEIFDLEQHQLLVRKIVENSVRLDCILPCIDEPRNQESPGPHYKGFTLKDNLPSYKDCINTIEQDKKLRATFEGAVRIFV